MRIITLLFLLILNLNAQIYVSVSGNDVLGSGAIDNPIRTIKKAIELTKTVGDTIYLREGIYEESETIKTTISGTDSNYKCLFAYNNEKVVIDFYNQPYSSSSRGFSLEESYWHFRGLEIKNAGDNGIHIRGHYNIVENCSLHHNKDTGLQISNGGSHNRIINCDSYLNYDPNTHGENADGFAPKLDIGPGNYFKNCRAWMNSDDGWDCYEGQNQMIIDSCWAFQNGFNVWNDSNFQGDGNGFKLGGNDIPAPHIVRNSIAFDNKANGFDQNNNTAGLTILNCTAFRNGINFRIHESPTDTIYFPSDSLHILQNNISFDGSNSIASKSIDTSNSWNGFWPTWQDFISVDTSFVKIGRDENYKIPYSDFLRLKPTSQFVDAGINVGISFLGSAPELGAFEYNPNLVGIKSNKEIATDFKLNQNYPNPFNPSTVIRYTIPEKSRVTLKVFDMLGSEVATLVNNQIQNVGQYEYTFNGSYLSSGNYFYRLNVRNKFFTKKMTLVK